MSDELSGCISDGNLYCISTKANGILHVQDYQDLSYDVASGSEITPCNKI